MGIAKRVSDARHSSSREPAARYDGGSTGPFVIQAMKLRLLNQKEFLKDLEAIAARNEMPRTEEFAALVNLATNHYGVAGRHLAEVLNVAPSAISRWVTGDSAPRPYARTTVLSALADLLREEIERTEKDFAERKRNLSQRIHA